MADKSSIEWTDATWNPITGCSVVSPGCANCYAMGLAGGRLQHHPSRQGLTIPSKAGPVWNGQVRLNEAWLDQPRRWARPRRIFVCAHGDLFHPAVPFGWVMRVFYQMGMSALHDYQVLTKRPDRMAQFFAAWADVDPEHDLGFKGARGPAEVRAAHKSGRGQLFADMLDAMGDPPRGRAYPTFDWACGMARWPNVTGNIWLGVSVEDQTRADERRDSLRAIADLGWPTWVSYEPALGPVDWAGWDFIRWLVSGGESGPRARPSHPAWHRNARDFCAGQEIAYLFKQWGEWSPNPARGGAPGGCVVLEDGTVLRGGQLLDRPGEPGEIMFNIGKAAAGRELDGRAWDQLPVEATP